MRLSRPLAATAAVFLALASSASALSCVPLDYFKRRVDTLDKVVPVLVVATSRSGVAGVDENPTQDIIVSTDTLSPAQLLADLVRQKDLHQDAFIGRVVAARNQAMVLPDGRVITGPVDTLDIEVEAVLKGSQSLGTHRFIDTVPTWHNRFTGLVDRRMIWFRGSAGKVEPTWGRRLDGTVAPAGPCGSPISGHPILPDWRVTRGGHYEEFGVGVPLTTVLQAFNGVAIGRKTGRTGAEGRGPAMARGGGVPVVLFTVGIPGRRGDAVSADGRRYSLGPSAL